MRAGGVPPAMIHRHLRGFMVTSIADIVRLLVNAVYALDIYPNRT